MIVTKNKIKEKKTGFNIFVIFLIVLRSKFEI